MKSADFRTPSEHDVDRVLYSTAYRRLSEVTQVVAVGERHLFHNRLTHTQKVAQLSRRIAQYLNWDVRNAPGRRLLEDGHVDVPAAEAAGLAHDLGHPPFGHIAEKQLDKLCELKGADGYEGNAQSFRIVTKLSVRRGKRPLDLSRRTLDGILKYPWLSDHAKANADGKWGSYQSERTQFIEVRPDRASIEKSVEASIMDWADDITYAVHDLEDFVRAGFINLRELSKQDDLKRDFVGKALREWKGAAWTEDEALQEFTDLLRLLPPIGVFDGSVRDRAEVNRIGGEFIDLYVRAARLGDDGRFHTSEAVRREIHLLKQFTWQYVIDSPGLATIQRGQEKVIRELFDYLHEWVGSEKRRERIPTRLRDLEAIAKQESYATEDARRARVVADYISSLTELQALDLHARLSGGAVQSVHDTWLRN